MRDLISEARGWIADAFSDVDAERAERQGSALGY